MKELVILSGKGGTGKTSLAGCFAALAERKVLCDADVDAADLYLLLDPAPATPIEFWSGQKAWIHPEKCTRCGLCAKECRFGAIHDFVVDSTACEGCGFCSHICPDGAITMQENLAGHWFVSETSYGPLVHARLGIAEENSGKLVTAVRREARRLADERGLRWVITDGPPGIGCPVISSLSGAAAALIITEPTLSGIHDLERVLDVCAHFSVPPFVCINKFDINPANTAQIESACRSKGIPIAGRIPYDNIMTEALIHGVPVVKYAENETTREIARICGSILKRLESQHMGGNQRCDM